MKRAYECGICNKLYNTIEERMACESKCVAERKAAEEEKRKAELAEMQKARKEEVDLAYRDYLELRSAYLKDYGHYTYSFITNDKHDSDAWEDFWRNF